MDDGISQSNYKYGVVTYAHHKRVEISNFVIVNNAINLIALIANQTCKPSENCFKESSNIKIHNVVMAANFNAKCSENNTDDEHNCNSWTCKEKVG